MKQTNYRDFKLLFHQANNYRTTTNHASLLVKTNKRMHVIVVKCSVSGKRRNKVVHGYVSTSEHTKHNAIVPTERADDAL